MVKYLNVSSAQVWMSAVLLTSSLMVQTAGKAQQLPDPMRPPSNTHGEPGAARVESGPTLQSVLISPRRVEAIIDGRTVKVGDKIGEAKIVKISESEVLLQNGKDLQVLKLFPNIEKHSSSGRSAPRPVTGGNKGKS